jgi:hypothetical protein
VYIFYVTEATSNLTRSLKEAEAEKLSAEKKRLQTLQNAVSFADFFQKEGDFFIHIMHGSCAIGFVGEEGGGGGRLFAGMQTIFSHIHKIPKSDY